MLSTNIVVKRVFSTHDMVQGYFFPHSSQRRDTPDQSHRLACPSVQRPAMRQILRLCSAGYFLRPCVGLRSQVQPALTPTYVLVAEVPWQRKTLIRRESPDSRNKEASTF